ncbi:sulfite exporter TauE/SafE family protein [Saccharospirillum mangrovi]|uniref:sulfite exporter TauE/SafE family protein n=1 Tax=Saccharospirillum mangrovi TaxID=2161747 RepID=UPI000D3AD0A2|nr:sulfite exporter TauE/SafE family protein [Saccharospirillum mangrovi]
MEILFYSLSGAAVGLIVGLTGVGGGALMTPLLLMFGFPAHVAIGTDLWYAAITKSGGMVAHHRRGHVRWRIVVLMASGSLPAAALTGLALYFLFRHPEQYSALLQSTLGLMLVLTAVVLILRTRISARLASNRQTIQSPMLIWLVGIVLGVLVTLSSVGAGAIGTAVLMMMFPALLPKEVVGTDIAHAVPLTLTAGMVHLALGNVDFALLLALIAGSLPAIYVGTSLSARLPSRIMHSLLATALLLLGVKYALF